MVSEPVLELFKLSLGQTPRLFFPVARDEGKRGAFIEERDRSGRLRADLLEFVQEQLSLPSSQCAGHRTHPTRPGELGSRESACPGGSPGMVRGKSGPLKTHRP